MSKSDQQIKEQQEREEQERKDKERITKKVLSRLGIPPGLVKVDVSYIYGLSYRVNVIVNDSKKADVIDMLSQRIKHSYFVTEAANGLISDPQIVKLY